jgi:hypothetical protein
MKAYGGVDAKIYILLTSALVGGEWSASPTAALPPGNEAPVPIGYEVGLTPVPIWTTWRSENS